MAIIGRLTVKLLADAQQFQREIARSRTGIKGLVRDAQRMASSQLAAAVSLGAIAVGLRNAFEAVDAFEASQRQLAATAKITGQNLGFLQKTAQDVQRDMGLGARQANAFTIEIAKLTEKAGQVEQTGAALRAFLDIGAARGLDAEKSLTAVRQAIVGIDDGTDKLFGKNPSVIYKEWADAAGTTAGKMTDTQKAQALLNAALQDGGKVAGEYARFLETPAGKAAKLRVEMENTAIVVGQSLASLRAAIMPAVSWMLKMVVAFVGGVQMMAADAAHALTVAEVAVSQWANGIRIAFGMVTRTPIAIDTSGLDQANRRLQASKEAAEEMKLEILRTMQLAEDISGDTSPLIIPPAVINSWQALADRARVVGSAGLSARIALARSMSESAPKSVRAIFDPTERNKVFMKAAADAQRWADQVTSAVNGMVSSVENGLLDLIMRTKSVSEAFRDMASSILRDLARLAIQKFITNPLADAIFSSSVVSGATLTAPTAVPTGGSLLGVSAPSQPQFTQTVSFTVNAIDARGVDQVLRENQSTILDVVARGGRRSSAFRAALQGA